MAVKRQDAWTPDDDLILAEVTLRHIREGGTQLNAFEEVAEKLGRTSAACGFRWKAWCEKNMKRRFKSQKLNDKRKNREAFPQSQPGEGGGIEPGSGSDGFLGCDYPFFTPA